MKAPAHAYDLNLKMFRASESWTKTTHAINCSFAVACLSDVEAWKNQTSSKPAKQNNTHTCSNLRKLNHNQQHKTCTHTHTGPRCTKLLQHGTGLNSYTCKHTAIELTSTFESNFTLHSNPSQTPLKLHSRFDYKRHVCMTAFNWQPHLT